MYLEEGEEKGEERRERRRRKRGEWVEKKVKR